MWNTAVKYWGIVKTSNYTLVTLLTSAVAIEEKISMIGLLGGVFILVGVYIAEKGFTTFLYAKK
jgi:drug/metabolite transporter (DMT)-like permease